MNTADFEHKLNGTTTDRRTYKIFHTIDQDPWWSEGCWNCRRYEFCNPKTEGCKPNKGKIRNWKEFRKTQYK